MAAQQTADLKAAMCGTWSQPRPLVFMPSQELPDAAICCARDLVLRVEREEIDGVPQRSVTLTNLDSGFTAAGVLNPWYSRIDWANGAVWRKTAEQPEGGEAEAAAADPLLQEATATVEGEEEGAERACCSLLDRGVLARGCGTFACLLGSGCLLSGGGGCPSGSGCPLCSSCPLSGCPMLRALCSSPEVAPTPLVAQTSDEGGRVLSVGIVSARGLSLADPAHSQISCRCQVQGKADADSLRTPPVASSSPAWNYAGGLAGYVFGEPLEFTLWDLDHQLGRAVLSSDQFHPSGFAGELPIAGARQGGEAFLTVDARPESALVGLLSERQVGNVVGRVRESPGFEGILGEAEEDVRELVGTVNRWLPRALAASAGREWGGVLQHVVDEAEDVEAKAEHLAAKLRDAFYTPLVKAVSGVAADAGPIAGEGIKLTELIVAKVVEELVETTTHELEVMGFHIPARDGEALA